MAFIIQKLACKGIKGPRDLGKAELATGEKASTRRGSTTLDPAAIKRLRPLIVSSLGSIQETLESQKKRFSL